MIDALLREDRRELLARWAFTADLEFESAAQIGVTEGDGTDETFVRDVDGAPILYGSALAGALRSALADRLVGYGAPEEARRAGGLFGDMREHESPLIVFDSPATTGWRAAIRDGVAIDGKSGAAKMGFKFDRELCVSGLQFPIRCDLLVPKDRDTEHELVSLLCAALASLAEGEVAFGARKTRGLGQARATGFRAVRYDLTTAAGWEALASNPDGAPPAGADEYATPSEAAKSAWPAFSSTVVDDLRNEARAVFDLDLAGTLLVRSPGSEADDPDMVHLTEAGRPILPGTSLAGVLRSHATRIVNTLDLPERASIIEDLFGSAPREAGDKRALRASRLRVREAVVEGARAHRHTRVKIDRFTGGALDTALFDEQPAVGGSLRITVSIRAPKRADIGLLALLARDLATGWLTVGGEASVGRGVLRGTVTLTTRAAGDVVLVRDGAVEAEGAQRLESFVEALVGAREEPK